MNIALWYMKKSAWISSKDEVKEADAKQIHTMLRKAAGIFKFILENVGMSQFVNKFFEIFLSLLKYNYF